MCRRRRGKVSNKLINLALHKTYDSTLNNIQMRACTYDRMCVFVCVFMCVTRARSRGTETEKNDRKKLVGKLRLR